MVRGTLAKWQYGHFVLQKGKWMYNPMAMASQAYLKFPGNGMPGEACPNESPRLAGHGNSRLLFIAYGGEIHGPVKEENDPVVEVKRLVKVERRVQEAGGLDLFPEKASDVAEGQHDL